MGSRFKDDEDVEQRVRILTHARNQYDDAIELFRSLMDRLHRESGVPGAEAEKTARLIAQTTQTLFSYRMKLDGEIDRQRGIVHDYALDLEEARDEIGRRLARIRSAGDAG